MRKGENLIILLLRSATVGHGYSRRFRLHNSCFDDPKTQIRLLRCEQQEESSESFKCYVQVFVLEELPRFLALSYVWAQKRLGTHTL